MSYISRFRLKALLVAIFTIVLLEGILDIHAAPLDSLDSGIATQEATGSGKVNQSSQSKTTEASEKKEEKEIWPSRRYRCCAASDCESGYWCGNHPSCWLHLPLQQERQNLSAVNCRRGRPRY